MLQRPLIWQWRSEQLLWEMRDAMDCTVLETSPEIVLVERHTSLFKAPVDDGQQPPTNRDKVSYVCEVKNGCDWIETPPRMSECHLFLNPSARLV